VEEELVSSDITPSHRKAETSSIVVNQPIKLSVVNLVTNQRHKHSDHADREDTRPRNRSAEQSKYIKTSTKLEEAI